MINSTFCLGRGGRGEMVPLTSRVPLGTSIKYGGHVTLKQRSIQRTFPLRTTGIRCFFSAMFCVWYWIFFFLHFRGSAICLRHCVFSVGFTNVIYDTGRKKYKWRKWICFGINCSWSWGDKKWELECFSFSSKWFREVGWDINKKKLKSLFILF